MKTVEYAGDVQGAPRSHPWVDSVEDSACRYYDLTAHPEHIRSSMEDFIPFAHYAGIEKFYLMLSELNQPQSPFESNDCAFMGPHKNTNASFAKSLQSWGRLMILFRHLPHNSDKGNTQWIAGELHRHLVAMDDRFKWGVIGTTIVPVRYLALGRYEPLQAGFQLMISFWAFGNSVKETMENTDRVIHNLSMAVRHLCILAA